MGPKGEWHELVQHDDCKALPVTYKYKDQVGSAFRQTADTNASYGCPSFTIGDVLSASEMGLPPDKNLLRIRSKTESAMGAVPDKKETGYEHYKTTMTNIPGQQV